jgi:hypothetical protein
MIGSTRVSKSVWSHLDGDGPAFSVTAALKLIYSDEDPIAEQRLQSRFKALPVNQSFYILVFTTCCPEESLIRTISVCEDRLPQDRKEPLVSFLQPACNSPFCLD